MIIVVSGEAYQAGSFIRGLRLKKVHEGYEAYSFDVEGSDQTVREILELLRNRGLFQKKKIVIVRGADAQAVKTIANHFSKEEGDIIVFSVQRKISAIKREDILLKHFDIPTGQTLRAFIQEEYKKRNEKPTYQMVDTLFAAFSSKEPNLFALVNEIEKLSLAPRHADDVLVLSHGKNPFALTDALAKRDKARMLFSLERELRSGVTSFDIVNRVLWQLRILILVAGSASVTKLPLHPFVIKKAREAGSLFSLSELVQYYRNAISLYGQILFSGLPSELLLSRFFWKL